MFRRVRKVLPNLFTIVATPPQSFRELTRRVRSVSTGVENGKSSATANESIIVALRLVNHGTKEMLRVVGSKVLPVSNFAKQLSTIRNNLQQGV